MSTKTECHSLILGALLLVPWTVMKATSQTLLLLSTSPQPVASQATATDVLESTPNDLPLIKITSMLPQSVQAALARTFRQESLQMANDGGKFNATDFVDRRYPMRRLIFAAVTGDKCLVHYEKGGYSHN